MMHKTGKLAVFLLLNFFSVSVLASVTVTMISIETNKKIGTITFEDSLSGLTITPDLQGLPPGSHGFHVHEKPSCKDAGQQASGHFDPQNTAQHFGPFNSRGHLGDLPSLYVDQLGVANKLILAPRLHESDLYGHAIIIHAGSDNFLDTPQPLGGGGKRIACGVIKPLHHP